MSNMNDLGRFVSLFTNVSLWRQKYISIDDAYKRFSEALSQYEAFDMSSKHEGTVYKIDIDFLSGRDLRRKYVPNSCYPEGQVLRPDNSAYDYEIESHICSAHVSLYSDNFKRLYFNNKIIGKPTEEIVESLIEQTKAMLDHPSNTQDYDQLKERTPSNTSDSHWKNERAYSLLRPASSHVHKQHI